MSTLGRETRIIDEEYMSNHIKSMGDRTDVIKTGFIDLDHQWRGVIKGCTYIIGARPAMGKTAFALNIMRHMAIFGEHRVAYFTLGLSKEQLINRLIAMESSVDLSKLNNGKIEEHEWNNIRDAAYRIGNSRIIINDTPGLCVEELRQELSGKEMSGVDVVFIDDLQLLSTEREINNKGKDVYHICEEIKHIAVEYNIAIIVLSQLSRRVEKRKDHRPVISDFIERKTANYFDVVSFLYRDDYYHCHTEDKDIAEIITAYSRTCNPGTVKLAWLYECQKFCNLCM